MMAARSAWVIGGRSLRGRSASAGRTPALDGTATRRPTCARRWTFTALGDRVREAGAELHLGALYGRQSRFEEGIAHERRAAGPLRGAWPARRAAPTLNAIGWNRGQLGDYQQALVASQQALTLHLATGNRRGCGPHVGQRRLRPPPRR